MQAGGVVLPAFVPVSICNTWLLLALCQVVGPSTVGWEGRGLMRLTSGFRRDGLEARRGLKIDQY